MSTGFRARGDRRLADAPLVSDERWDELDLEERRLERVAPGEVPVYVPRNASRRLPARAMFGATASWLALVFSVCYVAIPLALALSGINRTLWMSLPISLPSFGLTAFVAVVGAAVVRPAMRLGFGGPRDPVVSATLGGLGVWAIVHNTSAALTPFWQMGPLELPTFLAANVLEMTLLGMMLASFTRSRLVALVLGGGFQVVAMTLFLTLLALLT